jgi:hypothetical protein
MMKEIFYNVWWKKGNHWTGSMLGHIGDYRHQQNHHNPIQLSKKEAQELLRQLLELRSWRAGDYEVRPTKGWAPKVIPDFPLDPTLHVLHAGYIQDRQRKRS